MAGLLSNKLRQSEVDTFGDDQGPWRQYVLDHLDYIKKRSQTYQLSPELMNLYRFDLVRFLKESTKRTSSMAWIVLLLNGMPNDFLFKEVRDLIVPTDDLIKQLYHSYITIAANARK